jgi:hypothetical protein
MRRERVGFHRWEVFGQQKVVNSVFDFLSLSCREDKQGKRFQADSG